MPCVAGVSCWVPPSRYTFAAMTSLAVLRRRITFRPFTSKLVVDVSVWARAGAAPAAPIPNTIAATRPISLFALIGGFPSR